LYSLTTFTNSTMIPFLFTIIVLLITALIVQYLHYSNKRDNTILELTWSELDFDQVVSDTYYYSPATKRVLLAYSDEEKLAIVTEAVASSTNQFVRTVHYQIQSKITKDVNTLNFSQ
jgi:hypothetical protein